MTRATQYGEAFVGSGAEAAHLNTVLGPKGSAAEVAWTTALATPRDGHASFVVCLQPNLAVKPMTLFINKAKIESETHAAMTWGPAQAGVATGVLEAIAAGVIDPAIVDDLVLLAAVWVAPLAADADLVYDNNRIATHEALSNGTQGLPRLDDLLAARHRPFNGYYLNKA